MFLDSAMILLPAYVLAEHQGWHACPCVNAPVYSLKAHMLEQWVIRLPAARAWQGLVVGDCRCSVGPSASTAAEHQQWVA